jgi:hypothetical protein
VSNEIFLSENFRDKKPFDTPTVPWQAENAKKRTNTEKSVFSKPLSVNFRAFRVFRVRVSRKILENLKFDSFSGASYMDMASIQRFLQTHISRLTRDVWIALLAVWLLNAFFVATSGGSSTFAYAREFLDGTSRKDSWRPMQIGWEYLRAAPETPVYSEIFFNQRVRFQYPPSSLLIFEVVNPDKLNPAQVFNDISWYLVWILGMVVFLVLTKAAEQAGEAAKSKLDHLLRLVAVMLLTLWFYPLTKGFAIGQIQTALTLLWAISLLLWQTGHRTLSGFALGLSCAVKPQGIPLFAWGFMRRQWGMVAAGLVTFTALVGISIYLYGFQQYPDYLSALSFLSRHGESYQANQALNGLLNRMFFLGNNLEWEGHKFPTYNRYVYLATLLSSALLLGLALLWKFRVPKSASGGWDWLQFTGASGPVELSIVMLSLTCASPIAWEHHYGILLAIFACALPPLLVHKPLGRWTGIIALLVFLLAGQRFDVLYGFANTPFNFLQSYLYFAALAALFILYRLSQVVNGKLVIGNSKTCSFPIP